MDKASDFESEDCEFKSRRGRLYFFSNFYEWHSGAFTGDLVFVCWRSEEG